MARARVLLVLTAAFVVGSCLVLAMPTMASPGTPKKIDCPSACHERCGRNWKNKMCNKICNGCCNRCNCVPPDTTQETRHLCPCYDTMLNSKTGKPKCP